VGCCSNFALSRRLYQQSPFFLFITNDRETYAGFPEKQFAVFIPRKKNADWSDVFVRTNIIRQIGVGVSVFPGIA